MAKIQMGGVAAQVRGSIGNTTFSRNKGGAYIRARVAGVQPRSPAQTVVRANFAQNSKSWSGELLESDRTAWIAFAAANPVVDIFGASIIINGVAMFNRLNQVLRQIGKPQILAPPASYAVEPAPAPEGVTIDSSGDEFTLQLQPGAQPVGTDYYIFASAQVAPGRIPTQSQYRFLGHYHTSLSVAATIDLSTDYTTRFGALISTKVIGIEVGQVNTATGALLPGVKIITPVT